MLRKSTVLALVAALGLIATGAVLNGSPADVRGPHRDTAGEGAADHRPAPVDAAQPHEQAVGAIRNGSWQHLFAHRW